jgi:hypothetical protein
MQIISAAIGLLEFAMKAENNPKIIIKIIRILFFKSVVSIKKDNPSKNSEMPKWP